MRRVTIFAFVATVFAAATSAHAFEASCDFRKCMNICRSEYGSGCAGMCGRIISLCKQLVVKPVRARNARRAYGAGERIKLDAQVRSSVGRIN